MDIYEEVKRVAKAMRSLGFIAASEDILRSFEEGATGGEISMIIRFKLKKVAHGGVVNDLHLLAEIDSLVKKLDSLLS